MFSEKLRALNALKEIDCLSTAVNLAFKIFSNAIALFDTSYNLIAYSEEVTTDDALWNEIVKTGCFSIDTVEFFKKENFIKQFAESEIVAFLRSDKLKYDRMNGKLFDKNNVQIGNIILVGCINPFEDYDKELLETLCEIMSVKLQNSKYYKKIVKVFQNTVFNKIFDGHLPAGQKGKAEVARLYDSLKENLYLLAVDPSQYDETFTHMAYLQERFHSIRPDFKYFIHQENIIILVSTDYNSFNVRRDFANLNTFFKDNRIFAGVSGPFLSLNELHKHYKQALIALNYGLRYPPEKRFFMYDNYRLEHYLSHITNVNLMDMYHPVVVRIAEHDKLHNTEYIKLLYIYFLHCLNRSKVSSAAGISECELDNILIELKEKFELDISNIDTAMNIFVTLKLMHSQDQMDNKPK